VKLTDVIARLGMRVFSAARLNLTAVKARKLVRHNICWTYGSVGTKVQCGQRLAKSAARRRPSGDLIGISACSHFVDLIAPPEHELPPMVASWSTIRHRRNDMRHEIFSGTLALALLGGMAVAGAQSNPPAGQSSPQNALQLTPTQQHNVTQGLGQQQKQAPPSGFDGQVGSKVPDSMDKQSMPPEVTSQVPQTHGLLFVALPDRVLLIDPDSKQVLQIVAVDRSEAAPDSSGVGNTGSSQGGPAPSR
jgi:hypothetical protein